MAQGDVTITNENELGFWLEGKPKEWAQAIAVRAALRVLPLIDPGGPNATSMQRLVLQTFRANFLAWFARKYPSRDVSRAAGAAALSAASVANEAFAAGRASVAQAAAAAANAAYANKTAAVDAAAAASFAAGSVARDIWRELNEDAKWLGSQATDSLAADVARQLVERPLWQGEGRSAFEAQPVFPSWARLPIERLAGIPELATVLEPWIAWYRAIVPDNPGNMPTSHFGEALDLHVATRPDAWWDRDPREVNADVAAWLRNGVPQPDSRPSAAPPLNASVSEQASASLGKATARGSTSRSRVTKGAVKTTRRRSDKTSPTIDTSIPRSATDPALSGQAGASGQQEPVSTGSQGTPPTGSPSGSPQPTRPSPPPPHAPERVDPRTATETTYIEDSHDPAHDFLDRADLAFLLAAQVNQVWQRQNVREKDAEADPDEPPAIESAGWTGLWPKRPQVEPAPGFVVHIDAPWGGGKTSFANFLMRLLNPYRVPGKPPEWMRRLPLTDRLYWPEDYRRPWHIVTFNAWQHQHVSPPWWIFYQAIRKQTAGAILSEDMEVKPVPPLNFLGQEQTVALDGTEPTKIPPQPVADYAYAPKWARFFDWLGFFLREMIWRLFTPDIVTKLGITAAGIAAVVFLFQADLLSLGSKGEIKIGLPAAEQVESAPKTGAPPDPGGEAVTKPAATQAETLHTFISVLIAALVGGAPLVWTLISTVTSTLLPGTANAAQNYSLGSGDPLDRFRRHFSRMMAALKRPVLVVVDDLDRCEPAYVVELIRGMQTILKSPRVVFVLLGDRDWIEQCFTKTHDALKGIDVGPEHEFGARFAEKAIQLSFVLPDISSERRSYVRHILGIRRSEPTPALVLSDAARSVVKKMTDVLETKHALQRESAAQAVRVEIGKTLADQGIAESVNAELKTAPATEAEQGKQWWESFERLLSLRAAADETADNATRHRLEPLAAVLPPNPRQIKRIINAISLLQEVARLEKRIAPGSARWRALALWIILMIEWPKTWYTLTTWPGLANKLLDLPEHSPPHLPGKDVDVYVAAIKAKPDVMAILAFGKTTDNDEWKGCQVTTDDILVLREILPAVSGKALDIKPPKPPKKEEEEIEV